MSSISQAQAIDPIDLVAPDRRLFIDTNVFMDTDPRRQGLKRLLERVTPAIQHNKNPIIIPTKVTDELAKQSALDPLTLDADRAEAVRKAANALIFVRSAEAAGLVRNDLGDNTNPYADDLFVRLFEVYADRYGMFLLTNDITLLIRINLLGKTTGKRLGAGRLTSEGTIECETPQALYNRGFWKLRKLASRVDNGEGDAKDHLEIAALEASLGEYQRAFGTVAPNQPRRPDRVGGGGPRLQSVKPRRAAGAFSEAPAFKGEDELLSGVEIPGEGDDVFIELPSGRSTLRLGDKLGDGGEGIVYAVSDTHVVKIFFKDTLTRHRQEKIKLLASRGIDVEGICFPQAVVTNLNGDFVGYLMPKAKGREFSRTIFSKRKFQREFPAWTKADLVDVCISFLEKVSYLHSLNIILGDINQKNLLVDPEKDVWIIDADSWQLEGYPCPVGWDMFSAPEIIGKRYPLRTIEDERFAVATMLFMILITGVHPYMRTGVDGDIVPLIKEGNFAFQYKERSNQDQPRGASKYMWSHIEPGLKGLFWHTFHRDGDRYASRPTDDEWLRAFRRYRQELGTSQNFDPMSNDVYPTRFKAMDADTPIYECSGCKTSMVGIWNDGTKTYATPRFCQKCRSNLPTCEDCGKRKSTLKDGLCWECGRKRNYAACCNCGREIPRQYLIDGRCSRCQLVACKDCGTLTAKSSLNYGRCSACDERATQLNPSRLCVDCHQPFITFDHEAWFRGKGLDIPKSHLAIKESCPPRPTTSKPSRSPKPTSPNAAPSVAPRKSLWERFREWLNS